MKALTLAIPSRRQLTLGIPSKGRLMEQAQDVLEKAGYGVVRQGEERAYRGKLTGVENVAVAFLSASEIVHALKTGKIDAGITGQDLVEEIIAPGADTVTIAARLNFGFADVVVAVPHYWIDVARMSDLDEVAEQFYRNHGRRLRVATKYGNLTRRHFALHGVRGYRIVESAGATEGAPASGQSDLIVDITSSGATLHANGLKILDDGVILNSSAVLAMARVAFEDQRLAVLARKLNAGAV